MPTTYTHDLFGKKVYKKLPDEMKKIIRENKDLYRIGLHGPDIFFYQLLKKDVNRFGVRMHQETAAAFFEKGMSLAGKTENRALTAYMLGFGCHYLLDSRCHPYVGQMVEEGVINHTLLEKDWDRELLIENGMDPLMAHPADALVPKKEYAEIIHMAIPEISVKDIFMSVRMQKFLLNLMVYGRFGIMRKLAYAVLHRAENPDTRELADHFMQKEAAECSVKPIERLNELFAEALNEAPAELEKLYRISKDEASLSDRWNLTYNG